MNAPYSLVSLAKMYEFGAVAFHEATRIIQQIIGRVQRLTGDEKSQVIPPDQRDTSAVSLHKLANALDLLNVPVTKLTIIDAIKRLYDPTTTYRQFGQELHNISENLRRELESTKMFVLDNRRVEFYEPAEPLMGEKVSQQFPSLAFEIEQGGKCYAFDLTTASVFHWLRCLEVGIRAICRCLGVPDPTKGAERNWSNILSTVKKEIDTRWPHKIGNDGEILDKFHGALKGMQNPYRNATMHFDAVYTASDAIHIYEMVKGLMAKIACRMDENGLPKA